MIALNTLPIRSYLYALIVVASLPLTIYIAILLERESAESRADIQRLSLNIADAAARHVRNRLEETETIARALAERPLVRLVDSSQCDPILASILPLFRYYANVSVIDRDRRFVCSAVKLPQHEVISQKHRGNVMALSGVFGVSEPLMGNVPQRLMVSAAYPIRDRDNIVRGAVTIPIDLTALRPIEDSSALPNGTVVRIVTSSGVLVASSQFADPELALRIDSDLAAIVSARKRGASLERGADGTRYFIGFTSVGTQGWFALVTTPADALLDMTYRRIAIGAALAVIMAVIALLAATAVARRVVNPVRLLERAMNATGRGEQTHVPVAGPAEVRSLAANFNRMLDDLEQADRALEDSRQHLKRLSFDRLTGLPNRALFHDRLEQTISLGHRHGWTIGLILIELDRFGLLEDTPDADGGDTPSKQIATRILGCLRPGDTAARLSADAYAVILPELAAPEDAGLLCETILAAALQPLVHDGARIFPAASAGIAICPADGLDAESLIRSAQSAVYHAKAAGRNQSRFYAPAMNVLAREKMQQESRLRSAVEREEFVLHYQPKVEVASGNVVGFEALLRWQSPAEGLIPPDSFIPLLEETGLILPVGDWVLRTACRQICTWAERGLPAVPIAVNLSARQLDSPAFPDAVERALAEYQLEPRWIEFEITESMLMSDRSQSVAILNRLKSIGCRVSLDDFGTGYCSLGYLNTFRVDALKIDRSFVSGLSSDADSALITRTIITLAHSLGMNVIAEGIETSHQLEFLVAHGCDMAQGFLFAKPMAAAECDALLAKQGMENQTTV